MTLSARKRRRDDAALELRRRRASNSSRPLPDYDQGLALEEMLEMVAAGQGEDTGATLQSLAAMSLRMIKVLREKQEIERGLTAMRMSLMQAAHSSEKRETVELLRRREEENLALRLELETLRAQVLPEQEQDGSSTSSDSPSEFHFTLRTLDSSRDFNSVLEPFVRRWRKYEYYLRLLHQLGFSSSNSPPVTLLRVPYGTPFQKTLTPTTDPIDHQASYMHGLDQPFDADALPLVYESKNNGVSLQLLRALGPLSPSLPLAIHNGLLNPLGDPWDGQWTSARGSFFVDHSAPAVEHLKDITPKPRHTDVFIGPNGTFESATPGDWKLQFLFDRSEEVKVAPIELMASLREAGEVTSCADPREIGSLVDLRSKEDLSVATNSSSAVTMAGMLAHWQRRPQIADIDSTMTTTWPRKHRLELLELVDAEADQPLLKRAKTVNSETKLLQSWTDIQRCCPTSGVAILASQAMDITAIGPALSTNGKPRARRGSATDPQSVYARHRREKTNERLKNLQNLVPNGAKVDIVTMLDETIHYVKFLQNQVELLKSDDYWMYATPNNYNGMDLSELSQELESSA